MAVIPASGVCRQVLIALAMAGGAVAAECPPPGYPVPKPAVRLEITVGEPSLHNHRSRHEIAALAGRTPIQGKLDAGLTRTETEFAVTPTAHLLKAPDGGACVMLGNVKASWRLVRAIVDVATEYRPGSCEYQAVIDHENEHVRLTRYAFDTHAARLEARLREVAATIRPFHTSDADAAAQQVTDRMMAGARPIIDQFKAESRRVNAAIDTPESYRAVSAKCRKW